MNEKSQELIEFTAKVENQICSMENPQYMMLLHKKYVLLEPLKQIATEMNFTYRYVLKMHSCALDEFERQFLLPQQAC